MQKTEKHCKNQCFCYHKTTKISPKNGCKNSKIRLRARPPAEPQKKMLQTKKLRSKSLKNTFFFSLFACRFWTGAFTNKVSSVLFFTVFFEGERHDLSKTGGFGRKMGPPPPGKPVTFYECHPEDHAPAPSVRADFSYSIRFVMMPPSLKRYVDLMLDPAAWRTFCVGHLVSWGLGPRGTLRDTSSWWVTLSCSPWRQGDKAYSWPSAVALPWCVWFPPLCVPAACLASTFDSAIMPGQARVCNPHWLSKLQWFACLGQDGGPAVRLAA